CTPGRRPGPSARRKRESAACARRRPCPAGWSERSGSPRASSRRRARIAPSGPVFLHACSWLSPWCVGQDAARLGFSQEATSRPRLSLSGYNRRAMNHRVPRGAYLALFTVSGFAGLIYESIWSHYLRLFLGHAAYAQTLVLALFMGGMAIGAWLCSRSTQGWGNLLRGYAVAEAAIGIAALAFHPVYV